jgi:hypothetical protein
MSTKTTTPATPVVPNASPKINPNEGKREIVILQRGWIMVGNVKKEGNDVVITNTCLIRRWGTTQGIGQLALTGPTADTILDPCGVVRVHELAVVARIEVVERADGHWNI